MGKYRIIFMDGAWLDMVPPAVFHFPTFIMTCRANGFFCSDQCYVRFDVVRCVLAWEGDQPPSMVPVANAPTSETKQ